MKRRFCLHVANQVPDERVRLGVAWALGGPFRQTPPAFEDALSARLEALRNGLNPAEEARRRAVRDMLRRPGYKPTGRGKPASEYLLRTANPAADGRQQFPRISPAVDIGNLMSLNTLWPLSLWDLDRAQTAHVAVRLGQAAEAYVFNEAGQTINVHDLVVGCAVQDEQTRPIVNPVKDSQATKTQPGTERVAVLIYAPTHETTPAEVAEAAAATAAWLAQTGAGVETSHGVVEPEATCMI
ncbi:MAG: phenylalanine--tRNA ligase beta subunit-related protein [Bacteroidota bacterium]